MSEHAKVADDRQSPDPSMTSTHDDGMDAKVVAGRFFAGLGVLVGVLSLLGWIGNLFAFDALGEADADAVAWIADNRVDALEPVSTIISAASDTRTVVGLLVGATTMLWVTRWRRQALTVLFGVILEFSTFLAVGTIVGRPRPDVEPLGSVPSTPSFPSGHTAAALVLYGSLVLVARSVASGSVSRWTWWIPAVLAVLVAVSRVYDGVHHPLDVVAGLLLGAGALVAAAYATGLVDVRERRASWSTDR